jgi:hypothetical protein
MTGRGLSRKPFHASPQDAGMRLCYSRKFLQYALDNQGFSNIYLLDLFARSGEYGRRSVYGA